MDSYSELESGILSEGDANKFIDFLSPQWDENITRYRKASINIFRVITIQAVIIFLLSGGLYFYITKPEVSDNYFATTAEGKSMPLLGLRQANLSVEALSNWVSQATVQIMTFGFNDINQKFTISKQKFTDKGWESFSNTLTSTGIIKTVIDSQQLVTAAPTSIPVLVKEGIEMGRYIWVFEMDVLVTFRSGAAKQTLYKKVLATLEEVPTSLNPEGIGISEWHIY